MESTIVYSLSNTKPTFFLLISKPHCSSPWNGSLFEYTMAEQQELDSNSFVKETTSITDRAAKIRRTTLLPSISGSRYDDAWTKFNEWKGRQTDAACDPDEEMLLVYIDELSDQFASSSLWTIFSMLKWQMLVIIVIFINYRYTTNSNPFRLLMLI
jgi:hypothetical protein